MNAQLRIMITANSRQAIAQLRAVQTQMNALQRSGAKATSGSGFIRQTQNQAAATNNLSRSLTASLPSMRNYSLGMKAMSVSMLNAGKNTQWLGSILTRNITLPVALLGGAVFKMAKEQEAAMTRVLKVYDPVSTAAQDVAKEIDLLGQAFRVISDLSGFHIEDILDIAEGYAAAEVSGVTLAKVTQLTAEAMILGGMSAAEAAEGILVLGDVYGQTADEIAQSLAVLNVIENTTAAGFSDLLTAIQRTAGVARTGGVDIRHLGGLISALVPASGSAAKAGRSLKTVLQRVITPTAAGAKALSSWGFSANDAAWQALNAAERLELLSSRWVEMNGNQRLAFAGQLVGTDQASAFAIVMDDLANKQGRYNRTIRATADETQNLVAWEKELNTFLSSQPQMFDILTNRIRNQLIAAMVPLLPAINHIVAAFLRLTTAFSELDPKWQKLILYVTLFLAVLGPVASIIGSVQVVFGFLGTVLTSIIPLLWGIITAFASPVLRLVPAIFTAIRLAVIAMMGPIGLVVAAVVLLGVVFREELGQLGTYINQALGDPLGAIVTMFQQMATGVVKIVTTGFNLLPQSVANALRAVVQVVRSAALAVYSWLQWMNPFARHSPSLVDQVQDGSATISQAYAQTATNVGNSMSTVSSHLRNLTSQIHEATAAAEAAELNQQLELGALAGADPGTITSLNSSVAGMKAQLKSMDAAMDNQRLTIKAWEDQLDAANDAIDVAQDRLSALQDVVAGFDAAISASQQRLNDWLNTPVSGTYAFEDAVFSNSMAQKALQLQIAQLNREFLLQGTTASEVRSAIEAHEAAALAAADANSALDDSLTGTGLTADEVRSRMAQLATEVESLRGEQQDLRLAGAGSDVLGGFSSMIDDIDASRQVLASTLGDIADAGDAVDSAEIPELPNQGLIDSLSLLDDLQKQLDLLAIDGEILNLEEALALDPARKAIADTQRIQEQSVEAILAGIAAEEAAILRLTAERAGAVAAVEAQELAIKQLEVARDGIQASYDAEVTKLSAMETAYNDLSAAIAEVQEALDFTTGLGDDILADIEAAADAAAGAAGGIGDESFDIPGVGGGISSEGGLGNLEEWVLEQQDLLNSMFEGANPFAGLLDGLEDVRSGIGTFFTDIALEITEFRDRTLATMERWAESLFGEGTTIKTIWDVFWGPFEAEILPALVQAKEDLLAEFGPTIDSLKTLFLGVYELYKTIVPPMVQLIGGVFAAVWPALAVIVGGAIGGITLTITAGLQFMQTIFTLVGAILQGDWVLLWDTLKSIASSAWDTLVELAELSWEHLKWLFSIGKDLVLTAWDALWSSIGLIVSVAWKAVEVLVGIGWGALQILWQTATGVLSASWTGFWSGIVAAATVAWALMKGAVDGGILRIMSSVLVFGVWLIGNIVSPFTNAATAIGGALGGMAGLVARGMSGLRNAVSGPLNSVIGVINRFIGGFNSLAGSLGSGFRIGYIGYVSAGGSNGNSSTTFLAQGGLIPEVGVGGGFTTNRTRAIVGEGSKLHEEYVVPTDPKHRERAMQLTMALMNRLGMSTGGEVPQYASGGVIGNLVAKLRDSAVKKWNGTVGAWNQLNATANAGISRIGGVAGSLGRPAMNKLLGLAVEKLRNIMSDWWDKQMAKISGVRKGATRGTKGSSSSSNFYAMGGVLPSQLPHMANGGMVKRSPGGSPVVLGDGRYDEVVAQLRPGRRGGSRPQLNFYGNLEFPNITDPADVGELIENLEALAGAE